MNVAELKEVLMGLPDDTLVVLSRDAEGNSHSPLASYWNGHYIAESPWAGELWSEEDEREWDSHIPEDAEVPVPVEAVPCVVLWPTN